jgi:hypothetical protein
MFKLLFTALATLGMLSGCAVENASIGASRSEVIATYGAPSRTAQLATGTRLQYSRQPYGQTAVMVDLDAADKVSSVRQVLNPSDFARVELGQWTRETTEREFGRPAFIRHFANWTGNVLVYRWLDYGTDMLFYVHLDPRNVVQQVGQGMEFKEVREPKMDK